MLNTYDFLDHSAVQQIHEASLEVLQTTGLRVDHPGALEKMAAAGAVVEKANSKVKFPPEMVERALENAPRSFTLAGRSPEFDRTLSSNSAHPPLVRTVGGPIRYHDFLSGVNRPLSAQDCRDVARLADALENIDWVSTLSPHDILPNKTYDIHLLRDMLASGRKHIWALTINSRNLRYQLEMMEAIAGGRENLRRRPPCTGIVCVIEPYYFPHDEIERLLLYGKYNLPVLVPLTPISGANAPFTLAGAVAHTNAEALGSMVLLQTLCPGIPSSYYYFVQTLEMSTGFTQFLNPETLLIASSLARMGAHYNLPVVTSAIMGTSCESNQVMFERGVSMAMSTFGGVSAIGGVGGLDSGIVVSPLALVIDDELMAFIRRMRQGYTIDGETLAVEAINRVGHDGNFLSDDHTYDHLRREPRFASKLFDWRPYSEWSKNSRTFIERAQDRLTDLLQHHEVPPFDEDLQKELDRIIQAADKELATD